MEQSRRSFEQKDAIFYHRSYRRADQEKFGVYVARALVFIFLFCAVMYLLFPLLSQWICAIANFVLSPSVGDTTVIRDPFLLQNIYYLSLAGSYPSLFFAQIAAIVFLLLLLILPQVRIIPKNIVIWLSFGIFISFVSALFFVFFSHKFPYSLNDFSELYMKTQAAFWLVIPVVITMYSVFLPSKTVSKVFLLILILLYSVAFSIVRYTVFLYVLWRFSYIFMAPLFFIFGPLVDFLYIVGTYSFFISNIANNFENVRRNERRDLWQWV